MQLWHRLIGTGRHETDSQKYADVGLQYMNLDFISGRYILERRRSESIIRRLRTAATSGCMYCLILSSIFQGFSLKMSSTDCNSVNQKYTCQYDSCDTDNFCPNALGADETAEMHMLPHQYKTLKLWSLLNVIPDGNVFIRTENFKPENSTNAVKVHSSWTMCDLHS